ncbi:hypothetical protein PRIEUP_LOCUS741, partial [Pristimantis euphronides]
MEDATITLILVLGPCLTHACKIMSVTQNPPVLAAVTGKEVDITCNFHMMGDAPQMSSSLYHATNVSVSHMTVEPGNLSKTHRLKVAEPPDVYYCRVTCGGTFIDGNGTYVYVQGSEYTAPSSASYKLYCGLIALLFFLLLLAGSGTYLLLLLFFWKREEDSPPQTKGPSSAVKELSTSNPVVENAGGSLYMSLEPRSEEVYDVLEDKNKKMGSTKVRPR